MLNEYFGLGKKKQKFPVLKRRGAGLPSKLEDDTGSQFTASISSSRPSTAQSTPSLGTIDSDATSITCSEANFSVKSPPSTPTSTNDAGCEKIMTQCCRPRSGTILRVAAYWAGIKESLATTQPRPGTDESENVETKVFDRLANRPATERLLDMRCPGDDNHSVSTSAPPLSIRPRKRTNTEIDHMIHNTTRASAELAREVGRTRPPENLTHLPSVRLVHPSLAAVPGGDRRKDRVIALPELMKQNLLERKSKAHKYEESVMLSTLAWIAKKMLALGHLLIGPYQLKDGSASGSLLDGAVAMIRLLVLAYLVYCAWLVLGLVSDVIQAVCWPFRVVSRFVEWSISS
jgi:hypothetical protein